MKTKDELPQKVCERAMLVRVTMDVWSGRVIDKKASDELLESAGASDKGAAKVAKTLIPQALARKMLALTKSIRREQNRWTLPWGVAGDRILPLGNWNSFDQSMQQGEKDFYELVENFVGEYEKMLRNGEAKRRLGSLYNKDDFRSVEWVRGKFVFRIDYLPMPIPDDLRGDLGDAARVRIEKSMVQSANLNLARASHEAFYRLHNYVDKLHTQMTQPDQSGSEQHIHPKTYQAIKDLVEILPELNITGDARLTDVAKTLTATVMIHSPRTLSNNSAVREKASANTRRVLGVLQKGLKDTAKKANVEWEFDAAE